MRYYEIINVEGIIDFELAEIECINVVNFGNYSLVLYVKEQEN